MEKREREEDAVSESSFDNSSSSAGVAAGAVLICLFGAQQVRNLILHRRRRQRRIEEETALCKGTWYSEHDLEGYSISISDMDSRSDDQEERFPLPSPGCVESGPKTRSFELAYSNDFAADKVSSNGCDERKRRDAVAIEQVKSLIYQRVFTDERSRSSQLSSSTLHTNSRQTNFEEVSECVDASQEENRNVNFFRSQIQTNGLLELLVA